MSVKYTQVVLIFFYFILSPSISAQVYITDHRVTYHFEDSFSTKELRMGVNLYVEEESHLDSMHTWSMNKWYKGVKNQRQVYVEKVDVSTAPELRIAINLYHIIQLTLANSGYTNPVDIGWERFFQDYTLLKNTEYEGINPFHPEYGFTVKTGSYLPEKLKFGDRTAIKNAQVKKIGYQYFQDGQLVFELRCQEAIEPASTVLPFPPTLDSD